MPATTSSNSADHVNSTRNAGNNTISGVPTEESAVLGARVHASFPAHQQETRAWQALHQLARMPQFFTLGSTDQPERLINAINGAQVFVREGRARTGETTRTSSGMDPAEQVAAQLCVQWPRVDSAPNITVLDGETLPQFIEIMKVQGATVQAQSLNQTRAWS